MLAKLDICFSFECERCGYKNNVDATRFTENAYSEEEQERYSEEWGFRVKRSEYCIAKPEAVTCYECGKHYETEVA